MRDHKVFVGKQLLVSTTHARDTRYFPITCHWFVLYFFFQPDKKYEAVILPFFGVAAPFHISTIKVRVPREHKLKVSGHVATNCNHLATKDKTYLYRIYKSQVYSTK